MCIFLSGQVLAKKVYLTYDLPGGRFGDQLLSYMHAKWLSYTYDLTLLYKPFIYSEALMVDDEEKKFSDKKSFRKIIDVMIII